MSEGNYNASIAKIIFQAYFTAYSYTHTIKQSLAFLEDFKGRIYEPFSGEDEDAHFLRQMLVVAIGDYGTSPRSGWFEKEDAEAIKKLIESEIEDAKTTLSWSIFAEEDEEDERTKETGSD